VLCAAGLLRSSSCAASWRSKCRLPSRRSRWRRSRIAVTDYWLRHRRSKRHG